MIVHLQSVNCITVKTNTFKKFLEGATPKGESTSYPDKSFQQ